MAAWDMEGAPNAPLWVKCGLTTRVHSDGAVFPSELLQPHPLRLEVAVAQMQEDPFPLPLVARLSLVHAKSTSEVLMPDGEGAALQRAPRSGGGGGGGKGARPRKDAHREPVETADQWLPGQSPGYCGARIVLDSLRLHVTSSRRKKRAIQYQFLLTLSFGPPDQPGPTVRLRSPPFTIRAKRPPPPLVAKEPPCTVPKMVPWAPEDGAPNPGEGRSVPPAAPLPKQVLGLITRLKNEVQRLTAANDALHRSHAALRTQLHDALCAQQGLDWRLLHALDPQPTIDPRPTLLTSPAPAPPSSPLAREIPRTPTDVDPHDPLSRSDVPPTDPGALDGCLLDFMRDGSGLGPDLEPGFGGLFPEAYDYGFSVL